MTSLTATNQEPPNAIQFMYKSYKIFSENAMIIFYIFLSKLLCVLIVFHILQQSFFGNAHANRRAIIIIE